MCKANDVYIPVLVGDEIGQHMDREQQEPLVEDLVVQQQDEEEEDDGCDVITWLIFLGGLMLLITVHTMPCACEVVHGIEEKGDAFLRGAAKLLPSRQKDSLTASGVTTTDTLLHSSDMKPIFVTRSSSIDSKSQVTESSQDTSEDAFQIYSGSGLNDDGFDLPMMMESDADDDELGDEEEESMTTRRSIVHKRKKKHIPGRNPSDEHDSPRTIFSSQKWVDHVFVSASGSQDQPHPELLESMDVSALEAEEEPEASSTSHEIRDSADAQKSSGKATEQEDSPQSYSVSYEEVFEAAPSDDDDVEILDPVMERRTIVGDSN